MDHPDDHPDDRPDRRLDGIVPGAVPRMAGGDLAARLERWAAEARVDEAVRVRTRERWLRRQAEEESTVAGSLANLLERAAPVTVHTQARRQHRGEIRGVGVDFVALGGLGSEVVVALGAVTSLRTLPGEPAVLGDRAVARSTRSLRLSEVIAGLADEREPVLVVTRDAEAMTGVLRSVGQDVAVLRGAGKPPGMCYLPLAAISEIVIGG
jgi:hypothetical protein